MTETTNGAAMQDVRRDLGEIAGMVKARNAAIADVRAHQGKLAERMDVIEQALDRMPTKSEMLTAIRYGGMDATDRHEAGLRTVVRNIGAMVKGTAPEATDDQRGMAAAIGTSGGFTLQPQLAAFINTKVRDISPLARLARQVQVNTSLWEEPVSEGITGAWWAGENTARTPTGSPTFGYTRIQAQELYARVDITQRLLDDSEYDLGTWIMDRMANQFAITEGQGFILGKGGNLPVGFQANQPGGILSYITEATVAPNHTFGHVQYIPTGADGALPSSNALDPLLNTIYALRAPYRANARWLMNSRTAVMLRKLKDADGRFLWTDSVIAGQPATLLGYPVEMAEDMPDPASDSYSIAFGDWSQAYTIVRHPAMKMQTDPYSARPNVVFYAYRRVGGGITNAEAMKLIKFSAT